MPKYESQSRAIAAYDKENYDRIIVKIKAGEKEKLKALAAAEGESLNRYILKAVEQRSGLKLTLDNALPWIEKNS